MNTNIDAYLQRALDLSRQLCAVAAEAEQQTDCSDLRLLAFCGVMRDCAYRIQHDAEKEQARLCPDRGRNPDTE